MLIFPASGGQPALWRREISRGGTFTIRWKHMVEAMENMMEDIVKTILEDMMEKHACEYLEETLKFTCKIVWVVFFRITILHVSIFPHV